MAATYVGTMILKQGGLVLATIPGVTVEPGGYESSAVLGNGGVMGRKKKPVAPMVKGKIGMDESFDLDAIRDFTGDLVIECDNGLIFQVDDAWTSKPPSLSDEGEADVEWSGIRCRQL